MIQRTMWLLDDRSYRQGMILTAIRGVYFGALFGMIMWILLHMLYGPRPPVTCTSRWEGEIVALRQDSSGNWYCNRVDYSSGVRKQGIHYYERLKQKRGKR